MAKDIGESVRELAAIQNGAVAGAAILLERIVAHMFANDREAFRAFSENVLTSIEGVHGQLTPSQNAHDSIQHATAFLEAILQGAQERIGTKP